MKLQDLLESRPTVFYKGYVPGDTRRIRTGNAFWDSLFFVSSKIESARNYGNTIRKFVTKPGAKIAYEGTRPFVQLRKGLGRNISMLEWAATIARRAKEAGYDAVWFKMQGDIGTAIINKDAFQEVPMDEE